MRLSRAVLVPLTSLVVVGAHLSLPGIGSVATADAATISGAHADPAAGQDADASR